MINLYTFFFLYFVIQLPVGIEKLTFITLSIRFDTTELGQQETKARIKFLFRPQNHTYILDTTQNYSPVQKLRNIVNHVLNFMTALKYNLIIFSYTLNF